MTSGSCCSSGPLGTSSSRRPGRRSCRARGWRSPRSMSRSTRHAARRSRGLTSSPSATGRSAVRSRSAWPSRWPPGTRTSTPGWSRASHPSSLGAWQAMSSPPPLMFETPAAARRYGVRIDTLRDEPLLAALPRRTALPTPRRSRSATSPTSCVLLPREPAGRAFNRGCALSSRGRLRAGADAARRRAPPWDRRMLPVAEGEAVSPVVADWTRETFAGVVAVPFDPPMSFPIDLATRQPADQHAERIVEATLASATARAGCRSGPPAHELPDRVTSGSDSPCRIGLSLSGRSGVASAPPTEGGL